MKKASNILLSLFSLIIFLCILEAMARLYCHCFNIEFGSANKTFPETDNHIRFDSALGWSLKANYNNKNIQTNSLSLRSSIQDLDSRCKTNERILLLGDSMLFGYGIEQQYIFSEILNRRFPNDCFINTGVEGYSTVQEYLVASQWIKKLHPTKIVLLYTQENDMWWNMRDGDFNPSVSLLADSLNFHPPHKTHKIPYYKRLAFYSVLDQYFLHGRDLTYIYQKISFQLFKENASVWLATEKVLQKIVVLSNQTNSKLILIDIPTQNQLSYGQDLDERQHLLQEFSERNGLYYYNLSQYLIHDT